MVKTDRKESLDGGRRRIHIIDTTLRDGEQAPGVTFSRTVKLRIARCLAAMGIDELEAGTPIMGLKVQADLRRIRGLIPAVPITGWCRACKQDLEAAERSGVDGVHISFPMSDIHLAALDKSRQWVIEQVTELVATACRQFQRVSVGAQDATRADPHFIVAMAEAASAAGAFRIRIADTVGIARPASVNGLISKLHHHVPDLELEFHGHNDLGMATANTLAAVEAGAGAVSLTVNGLGERAGNAPLEQFVMALHHHPHLCCDIDTTGLLGLCRLVADAAQRPIPCDRPIVGDSVFAHESGIHCHAMFKDERAYEPFSPKQIGRAARRFVMGSHNGATALRHMLQTAGIAVSDGQIRALRALMAGKNAQSSLTYRADT